jgi:hypothetical protein
MASTDEAKTLNRLIRKLSAMRTTLRKDEREMLDQLLIGAQVDVKGHAASVDAAAATRYTGKGQARVYQGATTGVTMRHSRKTPAQLDEVVGHAASVDAAASTGATMGAVTKHSKGQARVDQGATTGVTMRHSRKTPAQVDEVMGHAANISQPKGTPAADTGATMGAVMRIDWDPDEKSYRINV